MRNPNDTENIKLQEILTGNWVTQETKLMNTEAIIKRCSKKKKKRKNKNKNIMHMFFTSSHYLIKIIKTYLKTYCEKHLSIAVSVKTRKVTYKL